MARASRSKGLQKAHKTATRTRAISLAQLELEKEYKRLRRNLLEQQRYYRQKGMLVYEDVIPKIPKKITASSIKRLQKIDIRKKALTSERIPLEKGQRFDPTTGEIYTKEVKPRLDIPKPDLTSNVPYYPTLGIIQVIRERISNLSLIVVTGTNVRQFTAYKNALITLFENTIAYNEDNLGAYINYLNDKEEEILSECDRFERYNGKDDYEDREESFANLAKLLKGEPLSQREAEEINDFVEYYNYQ